MGSSQLGRALDAGEAAAIAAFLRTLTGEQPRVELPLLPPSTADTPRPVTGPPGSPPPQTRGGAPARRPQ